jgi:prepilin-type N-terminal cleavage/methylation domain-containing protein
VRGRIAAAATRLRRDEAGYSLMELIVSMSILGAVMTSISVLLVSATNAEVDMNKRFQAQTSARLGLDRLRREVHCAQSVAVSGTADLGRYPIATLTIPSTCPTANGLTAITWCSQASGTRWELWRYESATCSGTGRKWADALNQATLFSYSPQSPTSLAFLTVRLPVNVPASRELSSYVLEDNVVLRNSTRT